jgi:hypothetical protein
MRNTDDLFDEAISLPVEERTLLTDRLLQSLNPALSDIDKLWAEEAEPDSRMPSLYTKL